MSATAAPPLRRSVRIAARDTSTTLTRRRPTPSSPSSSPPSSPSSPSPSPRQSSSSPSRPRPPSPSTSPPPSPPTPLSPSPTPHGPSAFASAFASASYRLTAITTILAFGLIGALAFFLRSAEPTSLAPPCHVVFNRNNLTPCALFPDLNIVFPFVDLVKRPDTSVKRQLFPQFFLDVDRQKLELDWLFYSYYHHQNAPFQDHGYHHHTLWRDARRMEVCKLQQEQGQQEQGQPHWRHIARHLLPLKLVLLFWDTPCEVGEVEARFASAGAHLLKWSNWYAENHDTNADRFRAAVNDARRARARISATVQRMADTEEREEGKRKARQDKIMQLMQVMAEGKPRQDKMIQEVQRLEFSEWREEMRRKGRMRKAEQLRTEYAAWLVEEVRWTCRAQEMSYAAAQARGWLKMITAQSNQEKETSNATLLLHRTTSWISGVETIIHTMKNEAIDRNMECVNEHVRSEFEYCIPRGFDISVQSPASSSHQLLVDGTQHFPNDTTSSSLCQQILDPHGMGCISHPQTLWWAWHNRINMSAPFPSIPDNIPPHLSACTTQNPLIASDHWSYHLVPPSTNSERVALIRDRGKVKTRIGKTLALAPNAAGGKMGHLNTWQGRLRLKWAW